MRTPAAKIVLHTIMVNIMLLSSLCILIFNGIINDVAAPSAICPMGLRDAGTSGRWDFGMPGLHGATVLEPKMATCFYRHVSILVLSLCSIPRSRVRPDRKHQQYCGCKKGSADHNIVMVFVAFVKMVPRDCVTQPARGIKSKPSTMTIFADGF